ncbi:MAG: Ig-like domain-containing protein [Candidatus Acidiferrum sp.]
MRMLAATLRPALSLMLSGLLLCGQLPAQTGSSGGKPAQDPFAVVKPDPKLAKRLVGLAAKAEAAGDEEGALRAYEEAARYAPFDVTIVSKGAALRSTLVRAHVDNAERLALDGNFLAATLELGAALSIDPSNTIVEERLRQLRARGNDKEELQREEPPAGLPVLQPQKATRSFNLRGDVRSAYEQIASAYGIKASFDPDLPARNARLHLENVDFDTAMKVLTLESGTSWRALNGTLMFVFADTTEKRRQFEPEIEETFHLPVSLEASEMTELFRIVRELTGSQHIQQSVASRSLTIRDTVPRVRLAGEIIRQLEHDHGEVLLEIDLLEVDRTNATDLGITPPSSVTMSAIPPNLIQQVRSAPSLTALLTLLATIFGGPAGAASATGITSLASVIPALIALGGGKSTFLLTLPTASAQFSQALSLVHSGRQVLLRAQDGKPATFFVGDRYPITLSLLSGSLGSTGFTGNPGGTGVTIPTQQFTVGQSPVALVTADFRGAGTQDLAVLNQADNSITILLNQGPNSVSQFAQASGSPFLLAGGAPGSTASIVSPAVNLTVTSATLASIAVTPANSSIAKGATLQLAATGTFSDGTSQDITHAVSWSSSNTSIAAINPVSGIALGLLAGTANITASLSGITSPAVPLNITSATLQSISVAPATPSIALGTTQQFTATGTYSDLSTANITTSATWASSVPATASISAGTGLAHGLVAGTTQITATLGPVVSASIPLKVTTATLKSIAVAPATPSIGLKATQQFSAIGTYSDGTTQDISGNVLWTSSNTSAVTINASSGLATGVGAGTAQITATQGGAGIPAALAVGSFNPTTDSFPDLLVASQVTNAVSVLLGKGDGTFSNPTTSTSYTVGRKPTAIAVGQINTNTNTNLGFVVTNFEDSTYSVFTGNGDGTFTQVKGSPFALPNVVANSEQGPVAVTITDFNGDGIQDLAIVNQTSNTVTVLKGNGDGTFSEFPKSPITVGTTPVAIASGTLSASTGPALIVANQSDGTISVLLCNGDGTFTFSSQSPVTVGTSPSAVAIGSFLEGSSGVAIADSGANAVSIFVDAGSGLLVSAIEPAAGTNPVALLAGDFTSSTFPDIVVANNIPLVSGQVTDGQVTLLTSPTSLISNPAISQQPYPGSQYEDIGLKVKATPTLHPNKEVTLQLDFEIKALAGSSVDGIPVITNRALTQVVRLKEDETSIITGLLDDEETRTITGLPGFAQIPGAGYAFGTHNNSFTNSELLILITPRRVRLPFRESHDIYAGRGDASGRGSSGVNVPPAPPPPEPPQRAPEPAPPAGEQPATPPGQPPAPAPNPPETPDQSNPRQQRMPDQPAPNPPPPTRPEF